MIHELSARNCRACLACWSSPGNFRQSGPEDNRPRRKGREVAGPSGAKAAGDDPHSALAARISIRSRGCGGAVYQHYFETFRLGPRMSSRWTSWGKSIFAQHITIRRMSPSIINLLTAQIKSATRLQSVRSARRSWI